MANWKKIGWVTSISAVSLTGLFFFGRGVFNQLFNLEELKKLSDQLQTIPSAKVHKIDFSGLTIRIDVKMKNPTNNGFKMKYPFVNVAYNKKSIGSSQAVDKIISIPPNGEANIEGIMLQFTLLGMFSLIGDLFKSLQSGQAVKLSVTTISSIDPLWRVNAKTKAWTAIKDFGIKKLRAIPYEDKQDVTLKKQAVK